MAVGGKSRHATGISRLMKVLALSIGLLLTLSPFVQVFGLVSGSVTEPKGVPYAAYGLSALGSSDRITLSALKTWTGNNLTVAEFESYIAQKLTPYDIQVVLLDIGWQNYTVGTIPLEGWVINWLTACDVMGIQNVLYVGQLTTDGVGSPWIKSVIAADPTTQTYYANGSAAQFISYDNTDVAIFLEKDLSTIYSYYESYPSWIGIGTGSSANDPYYQSGQLYPGMGYSNQSISTFVNSADYASDVNATGFLPSGQIDPLWTSYRNVQPSIVLSSGQWKTSSPEDVYGNGSSANYVEMRFQLQANITSLGISWYGSELGTPGPMVVQLYGDSNGSLDPAKPLQSYQVGASTFTSATGWQTGPNTPIALHPGSYWVRFSSPTSDASNYYIVYMKDQPNDNSTAYTLENSVGPGLQLGSSILWLRNQAGVNAALYPYQQAVVGNPSTQTFTAKSRFSLNTVFLFMSDRIFDPVNGTITLVDTSNSSDILATGVLSQQLTHGLEGWTPFTLNATVTTIPGHVYSLQLSEPNGGYSWLVALRGVSTDPPVAGFQGQGSSWLFELGDINWAQGHLDFIDETTNGVDAVTSGYMDATSFIPSSNETLKSFSVLMANFDYSGNYTSGTLSASVWNSSSSGLNPSTSPLSREVSVPAREVPSNGWLNFSGFNQSVVAGQQYWVVLSANSTDVMSLGRFTNAYTFNVQVSLDGGAQWQEPREGPSEFGFVISLSNQNLGTYVSSENQVQIDPAGYFAEPFYANETAQITGVYLGKLITGGLLSVSINPDTGGDQPSLSPLASGSFNAVNVTLAGPQFVQLSSVVDLHAGQKYWLVVHPLTGVLNLFPIIYLPNAPNALSNLPSVVSQNGGQTWQKVSNSTSTLVYELASPQVNLPEFNTSELAGYLSAYHSPPISEGQIRGWTGYVAASELSLFGQVTSWLNNATGRDFHFYGRGQQNVFNQLPLKDVVLLSAGAPSNSCSGLAGELTAEMPIADVQFYSVADSSFLSGCAGTPLAPIVQQLGYMQGTGKSYGQTSPTKVLVVGDAVSDNLTRYLSVAYNATYSQLSIDPSLGQAGNLSRYSAIIWESSQSPSRALGLQLAAYVRAAGTLIFTQFGGSQSNLTSISGPLPTGNTTISPPGQAFLTSLVSHTSYTGLSMSNSSTEAVGNSTDLSITIHDYGAGRFYLLWFSAAEGGQASEPPVLLSNIVATSVSRPDPFWYAPGSSTDPTVEFNVMNTGRGAIMAWLANTGGQNATFSLDLNGSYYGVSSSWKTLNLNDQSVATGQGSDLVIGGDLAAGSWLPVSIMSSSSAALIDYSNVQVSGQFVYPHQSLYELSPVAGQQVFLLLSSNTTAGQILVNDNQSLPDLHSMGAFSQASSGWIYFNSTDSFLVKFVAGGSSTLRLQDYAAPVQPPATTPMQKLLLVLVVLVCAEIGVLAYATVVHWRRGPRQVPP